MLEQGLNTHNYEYILMRKEGLKLKSFSNMNAVFAVDPNADAEDWRDEGHHEQNQTEEGEENRR